jgi:hypothetical protein
MIRTLSGWRGAGLVVAIFVANEGLFVITKGYSGEWYVAVRVFALPLLCITVFLATLVSAWRSRGWQRRGILLSSLPVAVAVLLFQYLYQSPIF